MCLHGVDRDNFNFIYIRYISIYSRYSDSLRAGRSGDRIPVTARFFAAVQTGPGDRPASYKWVPGIFPGGKAAGAWSWPPTPNSAEVKETVELYLYSPSGPSWPVLERTLPIYIYIYCSAVLTRQLRICETSRYRKSRNKNRVRSENIWPIILPSILTPVAEIT
jgi:hypothetical protein